MKKYNDIIPLKASAKQLEIVDNRIYPIVDYELKRCLPIHNNLIMSIARSCYSQGLVDGYSLAIKKIDDELGKFIEEEKTHPSSDGVIALKLLRQKLFGDNKELHTNYLENQNE